MTFNPGDIVEITRCNSGAPERARGFVGLRARVQPGRDPLRAYLQLIDQEWRPDGFPGDSPFFWANEHLRLVESAPREETSPQMPTTTDAPVRVGGFAVGDRLRVARPFSCVPIGTTGTVSRVDPGGDGYSGSDATIGVQFDTSSSFAASSAGYYGPGHFIARDRPGHGASIDALELVEAAPTPRHTTPEFTQKTGEIEVGDKVTLKSADDFPGNSSVPSSFAGVALTVIDKRGRIIDLQLPSGLHRCGWLADRFEHARIVDATAAPEPTPEPAPAPTRFVVGDRVRLTEEIGGDAEVGDLGTVEVVHHGGAYDVRFEGRVLGARSNGVHYAAEATLEAAPAATPEPMPEPTPEPTAPTLGGFAVNDKVVMKDVSEDPRNATAPPDMRTSVLTVTSLRTEPADRQHLPDGIIDVRLPDGTESRGWFAGRFKLAPQTAEPPTFQVGLVEAAAPSPAPDPIGVGDRVVILAATHAEDRVGLEGVIVSLDHGDPYVFTGHDGVQTEHPYGVEYGESGFIVYASKVARVQTPGATPEPAPPAPAPGPSAAHLRDIELIGTYMAEQAKQGEADGGWCSAYDRLIEGLNPQLTAPLRGRIQGD